jgi:hypothetical protein
MEDCIDRTTAKANQAGLRIISQAITVLLPQADAPLCSNGELESILMPRAGGKADSWHLRFVLFEPPPSRQKAIA